MCTCANSSLVRLVINIANMIADVLKIRHNSLELYPEEGLVSKAPTAPFALVDIVCYLN
jgi:hypothetical protein